MKCKDERGQIVIPIFYHIHPSEVRKQKRKYEEAFAKYEAEKKNVESWRKALFDAGNLSRLVAEGPETIFIKEIVSTISKRLCVAIPSDDLVGIEDRLQALKSMLAIDSQGVLTVGIWGIGGGGKTTLAHAIYNEISGKFDGCCFVENVREESSKRGLKELQKEILSCLLQKKVEAHEDVRMLIKRLRRKKVLLVLDDVDNDDQLKALAGSHDWFNEGSRVIITTRDQHLLNIQQVNVIYNISLLNDDEAMKLFCKHAIRRGNHVEDFDSLPSKVVSYAHGLPLALKVMGSFLCDKNRSEWERALVRLKDIPDGKILEQLKISYDGLEPVLKVLFLDIACFFRYDHTYRPMEILEACGLHPQIGVRTLIQKSLITMSEMEPYGMHDRIIEMAHYIVRGETPQNPETHSRVWRLKDLKKICAIPMKENHKIEALQVSRVALEAQAPHNLPHTVANMKGLRWISYDDFPATSLSRNFLPINLSYLRLQSSKLERLWEGNKILPNLKVLDLGYSKNLTSTPDFRGLQCLERIKLHCCDSLKLVHPSISHHETLISVDMSYCTSLVTFPPISGMKKLETLNLSGCSQFCKFPKIKMNMENMVKLSLRGTGIKVVPLSIGRYCTNLISLDLGECKSLESIKGNFHLLKHLKVLKLNGCYKLKIIEQGLFDLNYPMLDLCNTSFKDLHPGMKFLGFSPSLRKLSLSGCPLGDISSILCKLSNLQVLRLYGNAFSQLDCSFLQLRSLKVLGLSYCNNLVELPDLPESIAVLEADHCDKLGIVDLPTNLRWLWRISLPMTSISGNVGRKIQSMLQGNAIKDYSISLWFDVPDTTNSADSADMPEGDIARTSMLVLPLDWYHEFNGFLLCIDVDQDWYGKVGVITIKDVMGRENEDVFEDDTSDTICYIYISFGSLRHTSWWNFHFPPWKSMHNTISFSITEHVNLKVELVPGRSKGDSIERVKDTRNSSEF